MLSVTCVEKRYVQLALFRMQIFGILLSSFRFTMSFDYDMVYLSVWYGAWIQMHFALFVSIRKWCLLLINPVYNPWCRYLVYIRSIRLSISLGNLLLYIMLWYLLDFNILYIIYVCFVRNFSPCVKQNVFYYMFSYNYVNDYSTWPTFCWLSILILYFKRIPNVLWWLQNITESKHNEILSKNGKNFNWIDRIFRF